MANCCIHRKLTSYINYMPNKCRCVCVHNYFRYTLIIHQDGNYLHIILLLVTYNYVYECMCS